MGGASRLAATRGGHTALAGVRVGSTGQYEDSIRRRVSRFIGSIPAAATPSSQSGVWDWPTSRLEGVAMLESVSVSVPPGCRRLVASGCCMISNDPGSRLGRERLKNDGRRCKPVRGENSCAAWTSAVIPSFQEPLLLTTDQLVAFGRAPSQRCRLGATVRGGCASSSVQVALSTKLGRSALVRASRGEEATHTCMGQDFDL